MNIALVRPPGRWISPHFPDSPMIAPPRALLHLGAMVKGDPDVRVTLIDALGEPDYDKIPTDGTPFLFGLEPQEIARRAKAVDASLVGVTCMANYFFREACETLRALREALPNAVIVIGGPDPTSDVQRYLDAVPGLDAVAVEEGEYTFLEIVNALKAGRDWKAVAGLMVRDASGKAVSTGKRAAIEDLDAVQPDYDLVDLERYFAIAARGFRSRIAYHYDGVDRTADVVTSRGCPYPCTFCAIHLTMGRRYRAMTPGAVLAHLEMLKSRGVRHIHFEDDIINMDKDRFKDILRGMIDRQLKLTWDTPNGLRVDRLDRETVELCRASGCAYLVFGVESGNQRVLDKIVDKAMKLSDVQRGAQWCSEVGLDTFAFYIVGFPGETKAEMEETFSFAVQLYKDWGTVPVLQVWRPYVGTELEQDASARGKVRPVDAFELHKRYGVPFTLFRDRILDDSEVPLDDVAQLFGRYQAAAPKLCAAHWLKVFRGEPTLLPRGTKALLRTLSGVARRPNNARNQVNNLMFQKALYPNCVKRNLSAG